MSRLPFKGSSCMPLQDGVEGAPVKAAFSLACVIGSLHMAWRIQPYLAVSQPRRITSRFIVKGKH